jgi:hypothetical protein
MKNEYHEGPKAGENFKKLAAAVFQTPLKVTKPKRETKAHSSKAAGPRKETRASKPE